MGLSFIASAADPITLNTTQQCALDTASPFRQAHERQIFRISLENPALLNEMDNVREMYVWADGKEYKIYSKEARSHPDAGEQPYNQLFGQELKAIRDAGYTKLRVKYVDMVNEELSSAGETPYFTTTRTTIEKEEFFPIQLEKSVIDASFSECNQAIEGEKKRQSLYEILLATSAVFGLMGILWLVRRLRKGSAQ